MRCKEGDLAFVVRDEPGCQENIGRLVTVHGPIRHDDETGPTWIIVSVADLDWAYAKRDGSVGYVTTRTHKIEHPDAWLLPIAGEPEGVKESVLEAVLAW